MTKKAHKHHVASAIAQRLILILPVVFNSFNLVSHVENAKKTTNNIKGQRMTKKDHKHHVLSKLAYRIILKLPVVLNSFNLISHVENA